MSHVIVRFFPINDADYNSPAIDISQTLDQYHVDTIDVAGETVSSLKCESFAHALMHAAMILIYNPTVKYSVEDV